MDLASIPWRTTRHAGVRIWFYASDPKSGRTVALIAMDEGCSYPRHRHRGTEELLVLQGGYRDEQGDHLQGEHVSYRDGTEHEPVALPGPTCVLFAVAHEGIRVAGP